MYGTRLRIGALVVSDDVTTECEYWRMAPPGVAIHAARMRIDDDLPDVERLERMTRRARAAAADLATLRPNVGLYACTSGSFFKSASWTKRTMTELSAVMGSEVIATAEASISALRRVGARRIGVATPYRAEINLRLDRYFTAAGFELVSLVGAGLSSNWDVCSLSPEAITALSTSAMTGNADALFFACTAAPIVSLIKGLEERLGRPVITANQASFWAALDRFGLAAEVDGFGALFHAEPPAGGESHGQG